MEKKFPKTEGEAVKLLALSLTQSLMGVVKGETEAIVIYRNGDTVSVREAVKIDDNKFQIKNK